MKTKGKQEVKKTANSYVERYLKLCDENFLTSSIEVDLYVSLAGGSCQFFPPVASWLSSEGAAYGNVLRKTYLSLLRKVHDDLLKSVLEKSPAFAKEYENAVKEVALHLSKAKKESYVLFSSPFKSPVTYALYDVSAFLKRSLLKFFILDFEKALTKIPFDGIAESVGRRTFAKVERYVVPLIESALEFFVRYVKSFPFSKDTSPYEKGRFQLEELDALLRNFWPGSKTEFECFKTFLTIIRPLYVKAFLVAQTERSLLNFDFWSSKRVDYELVYDALFSDGETVANFVGKLAYVVGCALRDVKNVRFLSDVFVYGTFLFLGVRDLWEKYEKLREATQEKTLLLKEHFFTEFFLRLATSLTEDPKEERKHRYEKYLFEEVLKSAASALRELFSEDFAVFTKEEEVSKDPLVKADLRDLRYLLLDLKKEDLLDDEQDPVLSRLLQAYGSKEEVLRRLLRAHEAKAFALLKQEVNDAVRYYVLKFLRKFSLRNVEGKQDVALSTVELLTVELFTALFRSVRRDDLWQELKSALKEKGVESGLVSECVRAVKLAIARQAVRFLEESLKPFFERGFLEVEVKKYVEAFEEGLKKAFTSREVSQNLAFALVKPWAFASDSEWRLLEGEFGEEVIVHVLTNQLDLHVKRALSSAWEETLEREKKLKEERDLLREKTKQKQERNVFFENASFLKA